MRQSRRAFFSAALATAAVGALPRANARRTISSRPAGGADRRRLRPLTGQKALQLWAPAVDGIAEWSVALHADAPLFCGSAFKALVLAEFLRQVEAGATSLEEPLALDEDAYAPGAPVFNPPYLSGQVRARTVLEAMISHSDNTATGHSA